LLSLHHFSFSLQQQVRTERNGELVYKVCACFGLVILLLPLAFSSWLPIARAWVTSNSTLSLLARVAQDKFAGAVSQLMTSDYRMVRLTTQLSYTLWACWAGKLLFSQLLADVRPCLLVCLPLAQDDRVQIIACSADGEVRGYLPAEEEHKGGHQSELFFTLHIAPSPRCWFVCACTRQHDGYQRAGDHSQGAVRQATGLTDWESFSAVAAQFHALLLLCRS
jgi:hypothetical protein